MLGLSHCFTIQTIIEIGHFSPEAYYSVEREAAEYGDVAEDGEHPRLEWGAGTTIYTVGDLRRALAIAEECQREVSDRL